MAIIGVPTSAGAFAAGQEQAPAALRAAGLVEAFGGRAVDHGDREPWAWRPDRAHRDAQHLDRVVQIVRDTARRVQAAAAAGQRTLVLGGDCTVGIATVAGQAALGGRIGLVYLDMHADLNVPSAVRDGALDWMGVAHMLGVDGAAAPLTDVGPRSPLLTADQVVLLGWEHSQATAFEREQLQALRVPIVPAADLRADPAEAARAALDALGPVDRLVVHFDVDVVDFVDTPLSENTGRNVGVPFTAALAALDALARMRRPDGLTVTELNPAHVEPGADTLQRLAAALAAAL